MRGTPSERFWAKVEKTDSCWNWTGTKSTRGYGRMFLDGGYMLVHRFSYQTANGPIGEGLVIDHMCHNTSCVRPSHLRAVAQKQNMENRVGPHRNNTSGFRGVSWHKKSNKWIALVGHGGTRHYAGTYLTREEAEAAVVAKRLELHTHNDSDRQEMSTP